MTKSRTSSGVELLLPLRRDEPAGLHRQLEQELREAIRGGRLVADTVLPSTRALAGQLGVSRGVVVEAYEQLIAEGYLASRAGGTTRVADSVRGPSRRADDETAPPLIVDFRPGSPDLAEFPRTEWLRSLRRVLATAPTDRFGYIGGHGVPEVRDALATYLNRARGTAADPADVVICTGFAQGIRLIAEALRELGVRRIAFEDPSDPDYRAVVAGVGLEVVGVPVDEQGIRVDLLDASGAEAVVVTPAHQYPTGGVLPPARRAALVAWADRGANRWIVEDDYDAEYRYDRQPIGAIHGLCNERVIYAGSASKVLVPGLRLGWLVVPPDLAPAVAAAKKAADNGSSALDQLTFADFLVHGELDRHLRRMRPIYRRRRDTLLAALARHLPALRPVGASAGLHLLAWLPSSVDEAAIVRAADEARIGLSGVTSRRLAAGGPGGLIFGYGAVGESAIEPGIRLLAERVARVAARTS